MKYQQYCRFPFYLNKVHLHLITTRRSTIIKCYFSSVDFSLWEWCSVYVQHNIIVQCAWVLQLSQSLVFTTELKLNVEEQNISAPSSSVCWQLIFPLPHVDFVYLTCPQWLVPCTWPISEGNGQSVEEPSSSTASADSSFFPSPQAGHHYGNSIWEDTGNQAVSADAPWADSVSHTEHENRWEWSCFHINHVLSFVKKSLLPT